MYAYRTRTITHAGMQSGSAVRSWHLLYVDALISFLHMLCQNFIAHPLNIDSPSFTRFVTRKRSTTRSDLVSVGVTKSSAAPHKSLDCSEKRSEHSIAFRDFSDVEGKDVFSLIVCNSMQRTQSG